MRVRFAPTPRSSPESIDSSASSCHSTYCQSHVSRRQRCRHSAPAALQWSTENLQSSKAKMPPSLPRSLSERLSSNSSKKIRRWRPASVCRLKDLCLDVLINNVILNFMYNVDVDRKINKFLVQKCPLLYCGVTALDSCCQLLYQKRPGPEVTAALYSILWSNGTNKYRSFIAAYFGVL